MPVATRRQAAKLQQQQPAQSDPQATTREKTESLSSTLVGGDSEASNDDQAQSPVLAQDAVVEQQEGADSSSDDSSSDDDDSDSDSSSTASSDEEDDEDPSALLAALLTKAKEAARARAEEEKERALSKGKRGGAGDGLAGNEEVVHFGVESDDENEEDEDEEEGDGATPKASTSRSSSSKPPPSLPPSLSRPLSFSHSASFPTSRRSTPAASTSGGIALAQDLGGVLVRGGEEVRVVPAIGNTNRDKGKGKEVDAAGDRFGQLPLPKLSKKEIRAKQPPTAGPQWFNMPATPLTTELKRDLDALRLSNALDPKKFMRGGAKRERVGEFFQVGHIINPSTRATTLSDNSSIKKRSFIKDVFSSEQQLAYAKRKTKEVLAKGMSGRKRERQRAKGGGQGGGGGGQGGGGGKRRKV